MFHLFPSKDKADSSDKLFRRNHAAAFVCMHFSCCIDSISWGKYGPIVSLRYNTVDRKPLRPAGKADGGSTDFEAPKITLWD